MAKYIISNIESKDGMLKEIHKSALGRPAHIVAMEVGEPGWVGFLPEGSEYYHMMRTSNVLSFSPWWEDGNEITFETENTKYCLTKVG